MIALTPAAWVAVNSGVVLATSGVCAGAWALLDLAGWV